MPPRTTSHPARHISTYYETLSSFGHHQAVNEGATRIAFHNLLSEVGKGHGFTVLGEQTIQLPSKRTIRLDGEVKDQYKMRRGVWEAKDTGDDLDTEIRKKVAAGYPTKNTIFENTKRAVLFQNGAKVLDTDITQPGNLQVLLDRFFDYSEPLIEEFHQAVATFRREIPELAKGLTAIIETEKRENKRFAAALDEFLALCRASLNPATSLDEVEDMLKQHLLTERIFRSVFNNPDFVQRNAIARELEKVVTALTSRSFSRAAFTGKLDYFYRAIENAARTIDDYSEKQSFLHAVYEQFFQSYSTDTADTHGIVYTPTPIVRWMVASVEQALQREFGLSLGDKDVHILDPCVGTGTFILELIEHIGPSALPHKYGHELHCNEVLLLPYYIAAQNIEHEYYERTGHYAPYEGICFADTLDMGRTQLSMFVPENAERIKHQEEAAIFVIIGNPPYNVGQINENDNNKNRRHPDVDKQIRNTYVKSSQATLNRQLYDMYVRFFRWATDRLRDKDGIVCFVSNNSFLNQTTFDGMRKELLKDFTSIYTIDLGGNVRLNPKLSGTTHNVFGIQIGVAITLLIRTRKDEPQMQPAKVYYARLDEWWRKEQKYTYLDESGNYTNVVWQELTPNARGTWLTEGITDEFDAFLPVGSRDARVSAAGAAQTIFRTYSTGINSSRDAWIYAFDKQQLANRIEQFTEFYNAQLLRWERRKDKTISIDDFVQYDDTKIKWSRNLKRDFQRGRVAEFSEQAIRSAFHRPFTKLYLYFADMLVDERGINGQFFPKPTIEAENRVIVVSDIGHRSPFSVIMTNAIADYHLLATSDAFQCFPFYTYNEDGSNRRENITDWALTQFQAQHGVGVTKWEIFYYIYGLLHSPEYRAKYAQNLKRDLAHIPFVPFEAFTAFVKAGRALAALHVGYEQAGEYPLRHIENRNVPWTWRVERMRLSADKTQLVVNEALTLADIPQAAFEYRLGNRSALEWVIDQYQVSTDKRSGIVSDPNNPDDPEYIVRLVKQVITVSAETVMRVSELPPIGASADQGQ
jgi:predicted helicase